MFQNARTMFKIADEIRKPINNLNSTSEDIKTVNDKNINKPIFYI